MSKKEKKVAEVIHDMDFREWQAKKRKSEFQVEPSPEVIEYYNHLKKSPQSITEDHCELSVKDLGLVIKARGNIYLNLGNTTSEKDQFIIDENNWPVLKAMILYFTNDPRFELIEEGYSLRKGLFIRGEVGRGKTILLKLFSHMQAKQRKSEILNMAELKHFGWPDRIRFENSYPINRFVSCKQVEREFAKSGYQAIEKFMKSDFDFKGSNSNLSACYVFDDFGIEKNTIKNFGNEVNVMEEILMDRYEMFVENNIKTHITTNLVDGGEIEKRYGERVRSRIRQMFNVIDLTGGDRRK